MGSLELPFFISDDPILRRQQINAAVCVQTYFRMQRQMYATFGPLLFCRASGERSSYGTVSFLTPSGASSAQWIALCDSTPPASLVRFVEKYWGLQRPEVLISVTGGAQGLELSPVLRRIFDTGLAKAVKAANAWVVTGALDAGVMKLVASAMNTNNLSSPLIGFAPLGCVNGRDKLMDLEEAYGGNVVSLIRMRAHAPIFPFTSLTCVVAVHRATPMCHLHRARARHSTRITHTLCLLIMGLMSHRHGGVRYRFETHSSSAS